MPTQLQTEHDKHWIGRQVTAEANRRRNDYVYKYFETVDKSSKILDFACGNGDLTAYFLQRSFQNVYSVDFSEVGVEMTKQRGGKNVLFGDICEPLPYENNFFEFVLWLDNIEHLYSPQAAMENLKRIMKSGGRLLVSMPNMGYWFYRLYYLKNGAVIGTDGLLPDGHINMPWEYQHIRFFNEKFIRMFLEKNGFEVERILPYNNVSNLFHRLSTVYRRLFADGFLLVATKK